MGKFWGLVGGGLGEVGGDGNPLPVPQLHQVLVAHVSKSTGLPVNQSWVLALPLPSL